MTTTKVTELMAWTDADLFWYRLELAETYLAEVEELSQEDVTMLLNYPGFWAWWNRLMDNAMDLWLVMRDKHAEDVRSSFFQHMTNWLNGSNVHRSFWDANYERMIKQLIKNEVRKCTHKH